MRMKFMKKGLNIKYLILLLITMIIMLNTVLSVEADEDLNKKRKNPALTIYVKNDSGHGKNYGKKRVYKLGKGWNGLIYRYYFNTDGVNGTGAQFRGDNQTKDVGGTAQADISGYVGGDGFKPFGSYSKASTYGIVRDSVSGSKKKTGIVSHAGASATVTITPPTGYVFNCSANKATSSNNSHAIKNAGWAVVADGKVHNGAGDKDATEDRWKLNNAGVTWTGSGAETLGMSSACDAVSSDGSATINIRPNKATITYDGDGGTGGAAGTTADFYYDEPNNIGSAPSKTGYTFNGWYYGTTYSAGQATNNTFVAADGGEYTLTASWTETSYTIKYNYNSATKNSDGNAFSTIQAGSIYDTTAKYTDEVTLPSSGISRPGYTLVGWSTSDNTNTYTYTVGQKVSKLNSTGGTVNLYAVWEPNTNYIVYDKNSTNLTPNNINGHPYSTVPSGTVNNTSYRTDVPSITITSSYYTRRGYKFKGWMNSYTSRTADYVYGTNKDKITKPPVGGKTIYALWEPIQFTTEWYKGLTDATTQDGIVMPDTGKYSFDQTSIYTKSSSTFKGRNYTINYFGNKPAEATHEVTNVPSQTKSKLTFNSWTYINDSGTGSSIEANKALGTITAKDNNVVKFTAKWNSYTKVFSAPYLHGWTYKGYSLNSGDANQSTAVKQVKIDPAKTEFKEDRYASWEANRYYIVYDNNNGTKTNVYGDKITTLASGSMGRSEVKYDHDVTLRTNTYTRPGYKFKEWNTKADGSGDSYVDGATLNKPNFTDLPWYNNADTVDVEVKLYAIWEPLRYTITFNSNDTSLANYNNTDSYKQKVTGKNDFRDNSTLVTEKIRFDQFFNINECSFTRKNNLTLSNGILIKKGYNFIGWGRTNNLKTPSTSNTTDKTLLKNGANIRNVITPTADGNNVNLYALWYKDLELHFDMNGGKKSGSENKVTLSARIYNDRYEYTFHIDNTKNTSTVNQDAQIGSIDSWGTMGAVGTNKVYTRKDSDGTQYRFLGWSTNPDALEPDTNMSVYDTAHRNSRYTIHNDTTLYAVWEPVLMAKLTFGNVLSEKKTTEWNTVSTYSSETELASEFKAGEQGLYILNLRGKSNKQVTVTFDSAVTNVYNNSFFSVHDSLNTNVEGDSSVLDYCNLNKKYEPVAGKLLNNTFYVPMYLGTQTYADVVGESSYKSGGYPISFVISQDSFYYQSVYHTKEVIKLNARIKLTDKSTTSGGGGGGGSPYPDPTPGDPGMSILDQLRTKMKIRIR